MRSMKFECEGGNSRESIYALIDYNEQNPWGYTVMSIVFDHIDKRWWFLEVTKDTMTKEHMQALYDLLGTLLGP
jgi:hypothetical protein